jgi:glycosyltransferase involved in cell wall biosynthesis
MIEFSVVIPLYNKGPYIKRTLDSVLKQTIQSFEIIVIDGGSTDKGPSVVKDFDDPRIRFFQQKRTGVSAARNQGVNISQSDFIAFLDADDEWMPQHLETIQNLQKKFPQAGAYTTAYKFQEVSGRLRWAKYRALSPAPWGGLIPNYFKSCTLGEYPVWTSVVCIPKKIFIEMGGFPEGSWYAEDADLFGKIALKYPIAFSWYMGGIYHREAINRLCNRPLPLVSEPFVITALQSIENGTIPKDMLNDLNEYISLREIARAERNLFAGKREEAAQILKMHKTHYFWHIRLILLVMVTMPYPLLQQARKLEKLFIYCLKVVMRR